MTTRLTARVIVDSVLLAVILVDNQ